MTDRDRLIEILNNWGTENNDGICAESVADYLIENGVILPPCKVGNVVYCLIQGFENPLKATIKRIVIQADGVIISCSVLGYFGQSYMATDFGKTIFLTKEEAERALERNKDNTDGVII